MPEHPNNPYYPLDYYGYDFLEKVYLKLISEFTTPTNLWDLYNLAKQTLKEGEHLDRVQTAIYNRLQELKRAKKGGTNNA